MKKICVLLILTFIVSSCSVKPKTSFSLIPDKRFFNKSYTFTNSYFDDDLSVDYGNFSFDFSPLSKGYFGVKAVSDSRLLLRTYYEDKEYLYEVDRNGKEAIIPLQYGSGHYEFDLYKSVSEGKYYSLIHDGFDVEIDDPLYTFTVSNAYINFDYSGLLKKTSDLIADLAKDEMDYANKCLYFISLYIGYNYDFEDVKGRIYVPDMESIFFSKKAICIDFAALFAAMMRVHGIPCKVCVGTLDGSEGIHAWNEAYIDGQWVSFDPTYTAVNGLDSNNEFSRYHCEKFY